MLYFFCVFKILILLRLVLQLTDFHLKIFYMNVCTKKKLIFIVLIFLFFITDIESLTLFILILLIEFYLTLFYNQFGSNLNYFLFISVCILTKSSAAVYISPKNKTFIHLMIDGKDELNEIGKKFIAPVTEKVERFIIQKPFMAKSIAYTLVGSCLILTGFKSYDSACEILAKRAERGIPVQESFITKQKYLEKINDPEYNQKAVAESYDKIYKCRVEAKKWYDKKWF